MWYQIHYDSLILILLKLKRPDVILQLIVSDDMEAKVILIFKHLVPKCV